MSGLEIAPRVLEVSSLSWKVGKKPYKAAKELSHYRKRIRRFARKVDRMSDALQQVQRILYIECGSYNNDCVRSIGKVLKSCNRAFHKIDQILHPRKLPMPILESDQASDDSTHHHRDQIDRGHDISGEEKRTVSPSEFRPISPPPEIDSDVDDDPPERIHQVPNLNSRRRTELIVERGKAKAKMVRLKRKYDRLVATDAGQSSSEHARDLELFAIPEQEERIKRF